MALRDWAIIVILGIGWGMSFMFNAVLLRELDPLWISTGRVGLGALGCWAFLLARGRRWRIPMSRALALAGFGALSYAIPFSFYAIGQQHIASGVAGIVNASTLGAGGGGDPFLAGRRARQLAQEPRRWGGACRDRDPVAPHPAKR